MYWFLSTLLLISEPISIRTHYTTMILLKIETILGQPKHHKAHAWKLIFPKQHTCDKKTSCKYLFWRKISIEGETKYICPQVKAKSEMLIFLDCWPTVVCLLLTGSFPIKTPSTSKDPTTAKISAFKELLLPWQSHVLREPS